MSDLRDYLRCIDPDRRSRSRRAELEPLAAQLEQAAREYHAGEPSSRSREINNDLLYIACLPEVLESFYEAVRDRCAGNLGLTIDDLERVAPKADWISHFQAVLLFTGCEYFQMFREEPTEQHGLPADFAERLREQLLIFKNKTEAVWHALGAPVGAPLRRVRVLKGGGRYRYLDISEIWDAFMEKALAFVSEPSLTISLPDSVCAYRRGLGPSDAVAQAIAEAEARGCHVWLSVDLENAFGSVPLKRLRDLLGRLIPDGELVQSIMYFMRPERRTDGAETGSPRGLPQGSSLAPALFNAYAGHYLDKPWQRRHPDTPIVRFADDILILARTRREAQSAHRYIRQLAESAGFRIQDRKTRRVNMNHGSLEWLGHRITREGGTYSVSVPEDKWRRIEGIITDCAAEGDAERAESAAGSFLAYHAAAWTPRHLEDAVHRLNSAIDEAAPTGSPSENAGPRKSLPKIAARARRRWAEKLRTARRKARERQTASTADPREEKESDSSTAQARKRPTANRPTRKAAPKDAPRRRGGEQESSLHDATEPPPPTRSSDQTGARNRHDNRKMPDQLHTGENAGSPSYTALSLRTRRISRYGDRPATYPAPRPVAPSIPAVVPRRRRARQRRHSERRQVSWPDDRRLRPCTWAPCQSAVARGPPLPRPALDLILMIRLERDVTDNGMNERDSLGPGERDGSRGERPIDSV